MSTKGNIVMAEKKKQETNEVRSTGMDVTLNWDTSQMETTYANSINASSTREEVSIFFGTNQTWNVAPGDEIRIKLSDRLVLNPYAAKRLLTLLQEIIQEYEKRFGKLE